MTNCHLVDSIQQITSQVHLYPPNSKNNGEPKEISTAVTGDKLK